MKIRRTANKMKNDAYAIVEEKFNAISELQNALLDLFRTYVPEDMKDMSSGVIIMEIKEIALNDEFIKRRLNEYINNQREHADLLEIMRKIEKL